MRTFTERFTASFTESNTEHSLWDQGAWIREHGSGISSKPKCLSDHSARAKIWTWR
jgi:hypothetical protein